MAEFKLISACTLTNALLPPYINISKDSETGDVRVIVRGHMNQGRHSVAEITLTADEWRILRGEVIVNG